MPIYEDILATVGRTPVVRLNTLSPPGVNVFVKVESFNPMGSVKDRLALGIIEDAERRGVLKPGQTVIEATSGNTGIGLAMVCAAKGYPLVVTMAENFSVERRKMLRFLGARVVLTPASEKGSGMLQKAVELAERHGWFLCRQFENPANAEMHMRTTAVEILEDFAGRGLDWFVTGFGTGGTLNGIARKLKQDSPRTKIAVCEPDNSQTLGSGIPQERRPDGSAARSHPNFRPHLMQGWSPDFIPKLADEARGLIDRVLPIDGNEALRRTRNLARKEGIFCGITGGATLAGALAIAAESPPGTNILCMLPDTGERYLSTPLFEDIPVDMTDAELELSKSTPSARFDLRAPSAGPPPAVAAAELDAEAVEFIDAAIADDQNVVVMFAHEWCEFCWSVRKTFARYGIPYRSVDLDSVAYKEGERGRKIRVALQARTGSVTIPQLFVAGEFIGGCTDTFDRLRDGRMQQALRQHGVKFDEAVTDDPYKFLPHWLHPR
ncbi:MAG TPA: cysteine synthase A [Gammaproteobacteria bacterium]|jgi:cysteine synthase A|nr:cysteine synthase A [Gammaproteobacteria bacterium]